MGDDNLPHGFLETPSTCESEEMNRQAVAIYMMTVMAGVTLLAFSKIKEESSIWEDSEKEIQQNNRFFPKGDNICRALDLYSEEAVYYLHKGKKIYRARLIKSENDFSVQVKNVLSSFDNLLSNDIDNLVISPGLFLSIRNRSKYKDMVMPDICCCTNERTQIPRC